MVRGVYGGGTIVRRLSSDGIIQCGDNTMRRLYDEVTIQLCSEGSIR